jgi:hypothetical protein
MNETTCEEYFGIGKVVRKDFLDKMSKLHVTLQAHSDELNELMELLGLKNNTGKADMGLLC